MISPLLLPAASVLKEVSCSGITMPLEKVTKPMTPLLNLFEFLIHFLINFASLLLFADSAGLIFSRGF